MLENSKSNNYVAGIEYLGTKYFGWQNQIRLSSIQQSVEKALSSFFATEVKVNSAGRTDTGVHAHNQVINFYTTKKRNLDKVLKGSNAYLPKDIRLKWCHEVDANFHARFSAIAREYRYVIYNPINIKIHSVIFDSIACFVSQKLDTKSMQQAMQFLIGKHNFSSFKASKCQAKSVIKTMYKASVLRVDDFLVLDFKADAFLYHMIRNIIGTLIPIGLGKSNPAELADVIAAENRTIAGKTAPAKGLFFVNAIYDSKYKLPQVKLKHIWS